MKKIYFITGAQSLYGEETLRLVANDSKKIAKFLDEKLSFKGVNIIWKETVISSKTVSDVCLEASSDPDCIAIFTWMHTFSPAKMWIKGLQELTKPLLHLHTQANEKLPYDGIDMDFMNLNQSAHGGKEYGYIVSRLKKPREVVVGYYEHQSTLDKLANFIDIAKGIDVSRNLKIAHIGNNMKEVAVTGGDREETQIKLGWSTNYYPVGDIVKEINSVTGEELESKMSEYFEKYDIKTENIDAIAEQAKYEIGFDKFLKANGIQAFTDTFEDLYGLKQLPGLAAQRLMGQGYGFSAEGDYKTAGLNTIMNVIGEGREGATGFMEDYTYDLTEGEEVILGSHMLEVPEQFASTKPSIEVHPLGIGGKEDPARLVFDGITGNGVQCCLVDLGDRFRMIVMEIELVKQPKPMPKLPVARIMWVPKPDFKTGTASYIYAGGGHHTVVSTQVNADDMKLFCKMMGIECVVINEKTNLDDLEKELELNNLIAKLR